jgi:hypothetical protein
VAGAVIRESLALYGRSWRRIGLVSVLPLAAVNLVYALAEALWSDWTTTAVAGSAAAYVLAVLAYSWIFGALVVAAVHERAGDPRPSVQAYGETFPVLGSLLVAGVVLAVAFWGGILLFVVPGLLAATWWSVAVQTIVLERCGWRAALARSAALVRGRAWEVFGVVAPLLIVYVVPAMLVTLTAPRDVVTLWLGGFVVDAVLQPYLAIAYTALYFRLMERTPAG